MKALGTLIRLHKQYVDEARAALAKLEVGREALRDHSARLAAEVESEGRAAAESFEAGRSYPRYMRRIGRERSAIAAEIERLDAAVAEAGEALAVAYRELKKYEISRDARARDRKAVAQRLEQAQLDEIAITRHRRKNAA